MAGEGFQVAKPLETHLEFPSQITVNSGDVMRAKSKLFCALAVFVLVLSIHLFAACESPHPLQPVIGTTPETHPPVPHQSQREPEIVREIPLTVDTGGVPAVSGYPVSFGVPFPFGELPAPSTLHLFSRRGGEVPAQFSSLSVWPDGSQKSVLVTFYPEADGGSYHPYTLKYGKKLPASTSPRFQPLSVEEQPDSIEVDTGVARFVLDKSRFVLFKQIYLKNDANGILQKPAELVIKEGKGEGIRSGLFSRKDGFIVKVVEQGALRTVIKLEGKVGGNPVQSALPVELWLTFHANSGVVEMKHTIIDTGKRIPVASGQPVLQVRSSEVELHLRLPRLSYSFGGEAGAVYKGKVEGDHFLYQDASSHIGDNGRFSYSFSYKGVGEGEKAPGWMDVSNESAGVTVALKYFWENYPGMLSINRDGTLRVSLQPEQSPNSFYTLFPGVGKTHDLFLDFHDGASAAQGPSLARLFLKGPVLKAPAKWYADTEAFGLISPSAKVSAHWESKVARQYECTALRKNCNIYPQLFGKRDFGDYEMGFGKRSDGQRYPIFAESHYEDAHGWILEFLRQGDRRFFDYAAPFAIHHYDLDVMHVPNQSAYAGFPAGMIHWHSSGEHEATAKIEFGHVVPGGLYEYYLLTGDPRADEVNREQGDWVAHWAETGGARIATERAGDNVGLEEYERPHAWPLYTVLKSYEATGDLRYWKAATIIMQNIIDWWKMPQPIIVFEPGKRLDPSLPPRDQALYYEMTDWRQGNGYFLSTLRTANTAQTSQSLKNTAYQDHVPIAWMAAYLETAIIRYYEDLKKMGGVYSATLTYRGKPTTFAVDSATVREMIIQTVEVLVSHNWVSRKYPSAFPWLAGLDLQHWVYSASPERNPKATDGNLQMPFVLLYASTFKKEEVSERWRPKWDDLRAKWIDIARISDLKMSEKPETGYNGATVLWNYPYALKLLTESEPPIGE